MKKTWLFLISTTMALVIAYYSKKTPNAYSYKKPIWKTFEKVSSKKITGHQTTESELELARIQRPKRSIASIPEEKQKAEPAVDLKSVLPKDRSYQLREGRILVGDYGRKDYQDEQVELEMINKINPNWKEILGKDLLNSQLDDTKVLIKEEFPMIKVQNGKGQYLEQVIVTYLFKNGNFSSFHALVDSDSGFVTETWDKVVNERVRTKEASLSLPEYNNSGIIAR